MAQLNELKTALLNAHNAGDEQAARTLAAEIQRQQAAVPGASGQSDVLGSVYQQYPGLKQYGFQFKDSPGGGSGGRKLEFYQPGESHSTFEDKSRPGIERFDSSMGPSDIFGEMLHYVPRVDKNIGGMRTQFQQSISPKQKREWLQGDYDSQVKAGLFGDQTPSFDQWLDRQGGDAFFRGYLTGQYPAAAYTPEQKALFGQLDNYLRSGVVPERPPLLARVGRGAQDVVDRLAQLTVAGGEKLGVYPEGLGDIMTQQMNEEDARYKAARGPDAGMDVARFAGNAAMQAPLALVSRGQTIPAMMAKGAATGAASGALQFDPTNTLRQGVTNTGVGAAVGAVAAPVFNYLGNKASDAFTALKGRIAGMMPAARARVEPTVILEAIPEMKALPEPVQKQLMQEAIDEVRKAGNYDADALQRKANLLLQGVTPTKSMVTRSPRDWTIERNLQKMSGSADDRLSSVGEELTGVYQRNDQALTNTLRSKSAGLPTGTQEALGERAMRGVKGYADAAQKEVGAAYTAVHGDDIINPPPNALVERLFSADLQDIEDPAVKTIIKTVENRLKRNGIVKTEATFGPDGSYNFELTGKGMTAKQTEELRKLLNGLDASGNAGRVKQQIIRAIDESVLREGGQDVYGAARSQASQRFDMLDNPATQRALGTLGELEQGKTAQNFIQSQVVNAADQDVAALTKTLAGNKDALDSLQAGVLQHLEGKAINPNSGQFSGAAFNKALIEIGQPKLVAVFGEDRARELWSLSRAALDATYQPPYAAVNHANTAPMLLNATTNLRKIPVVGGLVTDEAQAAIKAHGAKSQLANALLAKGDAPPIPESPQLRRLIQALQSVAPPSAATAVNERRKPANKRAKQ